MTYAQRLGKQGNYELSFEPKPIWNYKRNNIIEDICDTVYKEEQLSKGKDDWIKAGTGGYLSGWNKEYHKRIVEFWSAEQDTVLDPFAGHSSSFVPFLLNRNFIGFEITDKRFKIQEDHLVKLKKQFKRTNKIEIAEPKAINLSRKRMSADGMKKNASRETARKKRKILTNAEIIICTFHLLQI